MTWTATITLSRQEVNFSSHIEDVHHRILREPAIQEVAGRIENIAHLDGAIYAAIMLAKALDAPTSVHLIGHDSRPGVFIRVEAAPVDGIGPLWDVYQRCAEHKGVGFTSDCAECKGRIGGGNT